MNKTFNSSLAEQLGNLIHTKRLKPKYFKGYEKWKKNFDYWYAICGDVSKTLDIIYGVTGGTDFYNGSIYQNSNFKPTKKNNTNKNNKRWTK